MFFFKNLKNRNKEEKIKQLDSKISKYIENISIKLKNQIRLIFLIRVIWAI